MKKSYVILRMKNSYVNLHMNSYVLYSGSWNPEKKGLLATLCPEKKKLQPSDDC